MNNLYPPPLSPEAQWQLVMEQAGQHNMSDMANPRGSAHRMSDLPLAPGDSVDDIVNQNSQVLQRRRSLPQPTTGSLQPEGSDRRMSMMECSNSADAFGGFQFGNMAAPHGTLTSLGGLPVTSDSFPQQGLTEHGQAGFATLPPDTVGNNTASFGVGPMAVDAASIGFFQPPDLGTQYPPVNLASGNPDFSINMGMEKAFPSPSDANPVPELTVEGDDGMLGAGEAFVPLPLPREPPGLMLDPGMGPFQTNVPSPEPREVSVPTSFQSPASTASRPMSQTSGGRSSVTAAVRSPSAPSAAAVGPPLPAGPAKRDSKIKDIYSKSGFDMLRALWYVATRKNPTVEIGAVDMSCSFVVCDLTLNDCPIIYVSDNFQNLTGYNSHEIVGKNCRFLQGPDGKVEAGSRREFVDNDAVFKLRNAIAERKEIQQSLINYRKGGKPFLNLLTMIPIPWDTDEMRYCIGFQIDLVECPEAISGLESTGAMQVNYRHSDIGQYMWTPPSSTHWEPESGQTLCVDDVSTLVQQFNPKGAPSEWHKQSWDKMLLENADDVVHVLSLKGLFLYLSPACKKILEYDTADLMGTSLSSICHPSDIVPVTRELKDAQQNASVDIVFRIRRRHSGYTWFESHGTLFHEQAKGKKFLILVGRKRPVFALRQTEVNAHGGGLGDSEIWSKMSASGMFLYVSSAASSLLDLQPSELAGTSMQDLMRKQSRDEFGRTIEKARKGATVTVKHEVRHKKGQFLAAQTIFYPGDTRQGQKPSFLIARMKLLKPPARAMASAGVVMSNQPQPRPLPGPALSPDGAADDAHDTVFPELNTTRCTSWQFELRQLEKANRLLTEELAQLVAASNKKKRKRRKPSGNGGGGGGGGGTPAGSSGAGDKGMPQAVVVRDCANCHRRDTPEWRRGPSGNRDLCNSCGLRWAKMAAGGRKSAGRAGSVGSVGSGGSGGGSGGGSSKRGSVSASGTTATNSPVEASALRREF